MLLLGIMNIKRLKFFSLFLLVHIFMLPKMIIIQKLYTKLRDFKLFHFPKYKIVHKINFFTFLLIFTFFCFSFIGCQHFLFGRAILIFETLFIEIFVWNFTILLDLPDPKLWGKIFNLLIHSMIFTINLFIVNLSLWKLSLQLKT